MNDNNDDQRFCDYIGCIRSKTRTFLRHIGGFSIEVHACDNHVMEVIRMPDNNRSETNE